MHHEIMHHADMHDADMHHVHHASCMQGKGKGAKSAPERMVDRSAHEDLTWPVWSGSINNKPHAASMRIYSEPRG